MSNEVFLKRNTENKVPDEIQMPQAVKQALMGQVPQIQSKYPTETFEIPSKGWFYPEESPLSKGVLEFKMMTAQEEDILTSQKLIRNGTAITKVIEKLLVTPGIKLDDLLLCDFNAIVYFIRRMAYGNDYSFSVTCDECGEKSGNEHVDLSRFECKEINFAGFEKGVNSFPFILPYSNKSITFKLLTHGDSKKIDTEITSLQKMSRIGVASNITTRLKYTITSVDGKSDLGTITKFVSSEMVSRDSVALRNYIRDITPELDTTFTFTCPQCGAQSRMELPMTAEFFWPSR